MTLTATHRTIRDHACRYDRTGRGPNLTLLHSVGLSTREGWREQIPVLAQNHTVLNYDFRGLGESEKGTEPLGVDTYVADLAALLDDLGHHPTVLMGVSLGGFVAQRFALAHPAKVKALVLVSTTCRIFAGNEARRRERNDRIRSQGMQVAADHQIHSHFPPAFLDAHPGIAPWYRAHYVANDPEHYIEIMQDLGRFDTCDALGAITCPTLIVAGDQDATSVAGRAPLDSATTLHRSIPNAQLAVIAGANHYPHLDHVAEFNTVVQGFLRTLGSDGA
jgi:pimeloyl-ACP methyl ester carboxylesterase